MTALSDDKYKSLKIVQAFEELRKSHRILVVENAACCSTCKHCWGPASTLCPPLAASPTYILLSLSRFLLPAGSHAECSELLGENPHAVGYVFYHSQDIDSAAGAVKLGHPIACTSLSFACLRLTTVP
jgi:hypothetical protein